MTADLTGAELGRTGTDKANGLRAVTAAGGAAGKILAGCACAGTGTVSTAGTAGKAAAADVAATCGVEGAENAVVLEAADAA